MLNMKYMTAQRSAGMTLERVFDILCGAMKNLRRSVNLNLDGQVFTFDRGAASAKLCAAISQEGGDFICTKKQNSDIPFQTKGKMPKKGKKVCAILNPVMRHEYSLGLSGIRSPFHAPWSDRE